MEKIAKLEKCGVCHRDKPNGIHIYHLFICQSCERKIIETNPEDPSYYYFINKLKQIHGKTQSISSEKLV